MRGVVVETRWSDLLLKHSPVFYSSLFLALLRDLVTLLKQQIHTPEPLFIFPRIFFERERERKV